MTVAFNQEYENSAQEGPTMRTTVGLIAAIILLCTFPSVAQQTDAKWIIGKWAGQQWVGAADERRSQVEIVFKEDGGTIRWELQVTVRQGFTSQASGEATVSGGSVDLQGKYDSGRAKGPLSYSLAKQSNDDLNGTGLGSSGTVFTVSWRRTK